MKNKLSEWRETHEQQRINGEAIEALARQYGLPDGFEVRVDYPQLNWCVGGWSKPEEEPTSIPMFRRMVEQVVARLGPADDITSYSPHYSSGNRAPNLIASWSRRTGDLNVEIRVSVYSPVGCKIKPGTEYIEGRRPELHPECANALKEIEELV